MKKLYCVYTDFFGEQQWFFDDKEKLIDWWDIGDAEYREEYMKSLFTYLGIDIKSKVISKKMKKQIIEVLKGLGYTEE